MNKFLLKASAVAMIATGSLSVFAAEVSVGTVNFQKALQETGRGKTAKASLEKEVETRRKEVEKLQGEIQKMNEEFQKKAPVLSEKARMEQGSKIQQKLGQMQELQQKAQMELQGKEAELTRPIIEGLRALIPELSRKRKLDLVFEASSGVLLHATSQTDITEELIRLYDEKNKK
jgi:outer membrane protein